MEHTTIPKVPQHSWHCKQVSGDEGKTIESSKGSSGSWGQPAEAGHTTSDTPIVTLEITAQDIYNLSRFPAPGDHYEWDEHIYGGGNISWEGDILKILDGDPLFSKPIEPEIESILDSTFHIECKVNGSKTEYGVVPPQSQKGCL